MKRNLFLPTLISVVSLLAISSIGATYAWYQYQTYVSIDFGGTSIDASKVFQVGLVSDVDLDCSSHNIDYEFVDGKKIYWVSGALTSDLTKYYLQNNGYGSDYLHGVTSGKYSTGNAFSLKRAPKANSNYYHRDPEYYDYASKEDYLHFGLAFKLSTVAPNGDITVSDASGVRLSSFSFMDYDNDLKKAVRVHFSNEAEGSDFIYNPSSSSNGEDTVGGTLDLFNNGVYDFYSNRAGQFETPYGEYESIAYFDTVTSDGLDRVPEMGGDGDSFNADHMNGVYAVDQANTVWSKSEYLGSKSVITNNKVLSKQSKSGISYFNMDIYLEGWDLAFINNVMDLSFGCTVEFESI